MDRISTGTGRLQSDITRRLDDFEKRGLLSAKMTEHYKMAIVKVRSNPIKFKRYVEQLQKDLDRINPDIQPEGSSRPTQTSPTASTFSSGSSASVSAFTEIASAANSNASSALGSKGPTSVFSRSSKANSQTSDKPLRWGDRSNLSAPSETAPALEKRGLRPVEMKKAPPKPVSESRNDVPEKPTKETVLGNRYDRKSQVTSSRSPMVMDVQDASVGEEQMQELFVEMCFFARLGYVQPPCCLRCTYREALKDGNVQSQCPRWVIWRKDTNQLLHPNQMEGNLLIVQCRAAGRLLAGKTIEGFAWSAEQQEVYFDGS
eukprot:scaffold1595_cov171-Amphora_coffeaeformis.AAC.8